MSFTRFQPFRLMRIGKRGNGYLRRLLIHGARTALPGLAKKETSLGRWLRDCLHERVVIVALANKLARIAWGGTGRGIVRLAFLTCWTCAS
jgi:transposase